jgi:hypothetical protein
VGPAGPGRVSYRNYGFWIQLPGTVGPTNNVASTEPNLQANTDHAFPGYNNAIPDQVRADEWLREFGQFEADGTLPTVELLRLPDDHTSGTTPGAPTPRRRSPTTTWRSAGSWRRSPTRATGPTPRSSWSKTTPRPAPTTSTRTAPSRR